MTSLIVLLAVSVLGSVATGIAEAGNETAALGNSRVVVAQSDDASEVGLVLNCDDEM